MILLFKEWEKKEGLGSPLMINPRLPCSSYKGEKEKPVIYKELNQPLIGKTD